MSCRRLHADLLLLFLLLLLLLTAALWLLQCMAIADGLLCAIYHHHKAAGCLSVPQLFVCVLATCMFVVDPAFLPFLNARFYHQQNPGAAFFGCS